MYTAIRGIFENGQVILEEPAPTSDKTKVVVMFLPEEEKVGSFNGTRQMGSLKRLGDTQGKIFRIPDDFNEPLEVLLEDLKEYI